MLLISKICVKIKLCENRMKNYTKKFKKGLDEGLVRQISSGKSEPKWLLNFRLDALKKFHEIPLPDFGPDLSKLDFSNIRYFSSASDEKNAKSWDEVDPEIKKTFERLRIPEAERKFLAGVGAQYESETVYHRLKSEWEERGVIFLDFDEAVREHPDLVRKYFSKCVPVADHKFSALHFAVFSGGTFLFVPKNVEISQPLQAYFRMNSMNQGQFEHTLIVIESGARAQYIEGCSAPKFGSQSLHAGCVEVFVGENADFRYSSVENWPKDTFNLNTKRAIVQKNGKMEWVGGNLGSGTTMLYPCTVLAGKNSRANHLGIAVANAGQNQDTGAKIFAMATGVRANVVSKSLSSGGGISTFRGKIFAGKNAENATISVNCDALLLDKKSTSDTIPSISSQNSTAQIAHEASAGRISDDVLRFFASRGIDEARARGIIVNGFLDEVVRTLPLEFASELNRLIELEMENAF